jgi:hypothetical protein
VTQKFNAEKKTQRRDAEKRKTHRKVAKNAKREKKRGREEERKGRREERKKGRREEGKKSFVSVPFVAPSLLLFSLCASASPRLCVKIFLFFASFATLR